MIIVCEPQCEGISHEKVNSGFLSLVQQAFPGEPIRLHAHPSHARALRAILAHDGVQIELEARDFAVHDPNSVRGVIAYHRQFRRLLEDAVAAGSRAVLFLSTGPVLLHVLKRLKPAFPSLHFAFVCHAELEDITNAVYRPVATTQIAEPSFAEKLRDVKLLELPRKARALVTRRITARFASAWQNRFRMKEQLLWHAGDDFTFIALAPHVVTNAAAHIDVEAIRLRTVEMPYNFAPVGPPPANDHLKLATFGFGDPAALRVVLDHVAALAPSRPYEVRIIGMDNRGLENHPHVSCPSPGKRLAREDMERHARDIDGFLILYDRDRYRLSCSGAIFEALSYVKPVLHVGNPCVTAFDRPGAPIGWQASDYAGLANVIARMIDDFPGHRAAFEERRRNIVRLREQLALPALAAKLVAVLGSDP